MTPRTIAKFYKLVSVCETERGYAVLLDQKSVKTPGRAALALPSRALAEAVAEEWRGQGERIDPATMRLTGLANVAIDCTPARREEVVSHILRFGRSDLLCYRAEAPAELVARQIEVWDPLLSWAAERYGASLAVGTGIAFVAQPDAVLFALERAVRSNDNFGLSALNVAASLSGSLVLALALAHGRLNAQEAFEAALVEEAFQAEKWGRDPEAEARRTYLAAELAAVERFLRFLSR